jgi:hypothetical protein
MHVVPFRLDVGCDGHRSTPGHGAEGKGLGQNLQTGRDWVQQTAQHVTWFSTLRPRLRDPMAAHRDTGRLTV